MRREVGSVVAESAQVDDLGDARPLGFTRDGGGRPTVELGEVRRAERMDEVVDDVDTLERAANRRRVRRVGGDGPHTVVLGPDAAS